MALNCKYFMMDKHARWNMAGDSVRHVDTNVLHYLEYDISYIVCCFVIDEGYPKEFLVSYG